MAASEHSPAVKIECEVDQYAPGSANSFVKLLAHPPERCAHPHLHSFLSQRVELGIAQHTRSELLVAPIPGVEFFQAPADTLPARRESGPLFDVRQRISLECEARAGVDETPLIGEMCIECVSLDPGAFGDLRDGRSRRAQGAVKLQGCLGDVVTRE